LAHNGRPHCVSLSGGLLPVAANSTHGASVVDGCSRDGDPGIRLQSAGLLQLGTQLHHREPFPTPAVGAERTARLRLITRTGQDGMSTSRLSYDNFTGCLFDAEWNSSWPFSCTSLQGSTRSRAGVPLRRVSVAGGSRLRLRSADARTCVVPRTRTQFCDMSFAVAGPRSGTVYRFHCVITVFTASESS